MPSVQSAADQWKDANPDMAAFLDSADDAQGVPTQSGAADVVADFNSRLEVSETPTRSAPRSFQTNYARSCRDHGLAPRRCGSSRTGAHLPASRRGQKTHQPCRAERGCLGVAVRHPDHRHPRSLPAGARRDGAVGERLRTGAGVDRPSDPP